VVSARSTKDRVRVLKVEQNEKEFGGEMGSGSKGGKMQKRSSNEST